MEGGRNEKSSFNLFHYIYDHLDSIAVQNAGFGEGNGSILFDDLICNGDEASLLECTRGVDINASNCEHREDAGVRCQGIYVERNLLCNLYTKYMIVLINNNYYSCMYVNHLHTLSKITTYTHFLKHFQMLSVQSICKCMLCCKYTESYRLYKLHTLTFHFDFNSSL